MSSIDTAADGRRGRLLGLKLRALVRDHLADDAVGDADEFAPGAALVHRGEAWVLLDDRPGSRLGAALAWAIRAKAPVLHLIAESATGTLARRAAEFDLPISVWHADGRRLLPGVAEPLRPPAPASPAHLAFVDRIVEGGAAPVVEHGVLSGEVRGLEVCRVVDDHDLGTTRLEVGVGAHDREAFQMLHGDLPTAESLARVVDAVVEHRRVGAQPHPLNRLAAERFLRWRLEQEPAVVGAVELATAPPPVPRPNLKDPVPCVATGHDADGRQVVAVCASGVDLDLVPFAADARLAALAADTGVGDGDVGDSHVREPRVVVVTPERDQVRVIGELASRLRRPVELVALD